MQEVSLKRIAPASTSGFSLFIGWEAPTITSSLCKVVEFYISTFFGVHNLEEWDLTREVGLMCLYQWTSDLIIIPKIAELSYIAFIVSLRAKHEA